MAKVLKGRTSVSNIPNFVTGNEGATILDILELGNSKVIQSTYQLNNILGALEKEVGASAGTKLPIETFEVYFQKGGIETASVEMKKQIEEFTIKQSIGYNVMAFDYSLEDQVKAQNENVDLNAEAVDKVDKITKAYQGNYLTYARFCALLSGTSLGYKLPTDGGKYSDKFGLLRGVTVGRELLLPTAKDTKRDHYRTVKTSSGVTEDDIYECVRMLMAYKTYSKRGIQVLGAPSTIHKILGSAYTAPTNVDEIKVGMTSPIPKPYGIDWIAVPEMEGQDFLIFIDKGRKDILFRRVEKSEEFRGLGILTEDKTMAFKTVTDVQGSKLRIFPEEWYLTGRESAIILDTNGTRSHTTGVMQTNSITALEEFAKLCLSAYDIEYAEKA